MKSYLPKLIRYPFLRSVFLLFSITVLLCSLFSGISFLLLNDFDSKFERVSKEYQYFLLNSNTTSQGLISMRSSSKGYELMERFSYITWTEQESFPTSPVVVVSEFGGDEYKCTGYCYCEPLETSEYRRTSSIISSSKRKLISVLVIAASSTLAFKSAESIFERECKERYSDLCGEKISTILYAEERSSPEQCDLFEYIEEELEKEKYLSDHEKYHCHGRCLTKLSFKDPEAKRLAREFDCDNMKHEEEIIADCTKTKYRGDCNKIATFKYRKLLTKFCKSNSKITYYYRNPDLKYQKTRMLYTFQACVGTKWNFSPAKCKLILDSQEKKTK